MKTFDLCTSIFMSVVPTVYIVASWGAHNISIHGNRLGSPIGCGVPHYKLPHSTLMFRGKKVFI